MIEQRTVIRPTCPAELLLPLDPRPAVPADARLTGNEAGMRWLAQIMERLGLVEDRIADARKECP